MRCSRRRAAAAHGRRRQRRRRCWPRCASAAAAWPRWPRCGAACARAPCISSPSSAGTPCCADAPLSCPKVVATAASRLAGRCLMPVRDCSNRVGALHAAGVPHRAAAAVQGRTAQRRTHAERAMGLCPHGSCRGRAHALCGRMHSAVSLAALWSQRMADAGAGGWTRARPPWPPRRRASPSRARARRTLHSACCRRPARRPRRARRRRTGAPRRARGAPALLPCGH